MKLFFDGEKAIRYESAPLPFDMAVRDTALRVANEIVRYINTFTGRPAVERLIRETRFFENDYLPDWIKKPEYFAPKSGRDNVFAARFDFALHNNRPHLIELNTACPAGHVFYPAVCSLVGRRALSRDLVFSSYKGDYFSGLLAGRAAKAGAKPHIALVASAVGNISNELCDLRRQILDKGARCSICNIQDISYRGGVPFYGGSRIDLVWCKFNDLYSAPLRGLVDNDPAYLKNLLDAHVKDRVDLVNPPLAFYLFEDKAFLAVLRRELPGDCREFVAETGLIRPPSGKAAGVAPAELEKKRDSFILKPRLGTRADGVITGASAPGRVWKDFLRDISPKCSYVAQRLCNNSYSGSNKEFKTLSVPIYAGRPAAITGRLDTLFPVSVGKGARIFAFSAAVPALAEEKKILAAFNGRYFPEKKFPGYGEKRVQLYNDILRIFDIAFAHTSLGKVAGKIKYFNARPDVYVEKGNPWLLEFNIDPGVSPQSHIAYFQQLYGMRFRNDSGQNVLPFVESLSRLVREIDGPLAILGSESDADIFDAADRWLVAKIKQATAAEIKFYPAGEWSRLKRLKEPFLIRWLSMCQIRKLRPLGAAYERLLGSSEDLSPGKYSDIAVSKRILAELWDIVNSGRLSPGDRAVIRRAIPWSAVLRRGGRYIYGREKLAAPDILRRKNDFVIKKMHSYRAQDVYVGKDLAPAAWEAALDSALASGEYIVQRHVGNDLEMNVPLRTVDGKNTVKKLAYMVSPFIMGRTMAGTFVRAWSATDPEVPFEKKIVGTTDDFIC